METRTVETSTGFASDSTPLYGIRWAAVLAGLAVGLGVHLLLLLIGAAAGFAVFGSGVRPDGGSISLATALWNSVSLLIAALVGGYVAARASGLRRTADGVLHAVASWGASMLCYALLTGSVAGNALTGVVGMAAGSMGITATQNTESSMTELLAGLERGDRAGAARMLRDRFGLSPEQADRLADRALALTGGAGAQGAGGENATDAAQAASATSAWLSLVILLSMAAGACGGMIGARGSLKRSRPGPGQYREDRVIRQHTSGHGLPNVG